MATLWREVVESNKEFLETILENFTVALTQLPTDVRHKIFSRPLSSTGCHGSGHSGAIGLPHTKT